MKSVEFCYWLQGFFEISDVAHYPKGLDGNQADMIKKHLALVFKHEIDPSYGDQNHQNELNAIHNPPSEDNVQFLHSPEPWQIKQEGSMGLSDGNITYRC